jgi:arginine/ornithine transport system substrate-binding protein
MMWQRTLLATIVAFIWVDAASVAAAGDLPLRIAVQNERPPFSFRDDEDELQGFDVEIARALCAALRLECELASLQFTDLIPALQQDRIDAAVASMSITAERLQLVDFTDKYYHAPNRFVARRGAVLDIAPASLAGKTIGVKRGTIHDRYLTAEYANAAAIRRYGYSDEIFIDLALGRLDLAFADGITLTESFLKAELGEEFEFVGPALADPRWFGNGEGVAVRKGDTELLARLNRALQQIFSDGTYEAIQRKYFDYDIAGEAVPLAQPVAAGRP